MRLNADTYTNHGRRSLSALTPVVAIIPISTEISAEFRDFFTSVINETKTSDGIYSATLKQLKYTSLNFGNVAPTFYKSTFEMFTPAVNMANAKRW